MLFNSLEFIFIFFPLVFLLFIFLSKISKSEINKIFLVLASLSFYGYWNPKYVLLILFSMGINYELSKRIMKPTKYQGVLYASGIIFNLGLLGFFKYADFFIKNYNFLSSSGYSLLNLTLPLAISFFTFQQIAYLTDVKRGEVVEHSPINYALFITFFPQLIAGPIVHHKEMMPQFEIKHNGQFDYDSIAKGIFLFSIGLFKKVIIADTFAKWADFGFSGEANLTFISSWAYSLSYTFQLYFDFSGYTDMAFGLAMFFGIRLPQNFNSPYKAVNIQDFWRRWHMTLSRFLKDYLYVPLGGNRLGTNRTLLNLFLTFLLGGFWHGASWMFVIWGSLHGLALVLHRLWQLAEIQIPKPLGWFFTFIFVNFCWIFFRSESLDLSLRMLASMFNFLDFSVGDLIAHRKEILSILVGLTVCVFLKNSIELSLKFKPSIIYWLWTLLASFSIFRISDNQPFLYFDF